MKRLVLVSSLMVLGMNIVAEAKVYRWVDDEGNVVYSQVPPPDPAMAEEVELPAAGEPAASNERKAPEAKAEKETPADYDRKKLEGMDPELRKEYCEKARKNIEILEKAEPGSAFVTEKNEIVKFNEEERAKRLENARRAESAYCKEKVSE